MSALRRVYNCFVNQCKNGTLKKFEANRTSISSEITHIMDCEAYTHDKETHLREISIWDLTEDKAYSYQVYYEEGVISRYSRTVGYQINNVHGLQIETSKIDENYYPLREIVDILIERFADKKTLVAYKGGTIEFDLLQDLNVKSINIELIECPRFSELLEHFKLPVKCCKYHMKTDIQYHCSKYEVILFTAYIKQMQRKDYQKYIKYYTDN